MDTTSTYAYDGHRWRMKKIVNGTMTIYIYSGSKVLAEYVNGAAPTAPTKEYVYSGGALLATLAGSTVTYHYPDHLSNRFETDAVGSVARTFGHLPFGEIWYETGTPDKWKFTGYERDSTESGLDYAMNRSYSSGYGRFQSADPDMGSMGLASPQSLNRYEYVLEDPVDLIDPFGLDHTGYFINDNGCIQEMIYTSTFAIGKDGVGRQKVSATPGDVVFCPSSGDPNTGGGADFSWLVTFAKEFVNFFGRAGRGANLCWANLKKYWGGVSWREHGIRGRRNLLESGQCIPDREGPAVCCNSAKFIGWSRFDLSQLLIRI